MPFSGPGPLGLVDYRQCRIWCYVSNAERPNKQYNTEFERNRKVLCLLVVWVWVCESGSVCLLKVAAGSAGPGRVTERDSAWRDVTRPTARLLMSCIAAISATRSRQECSANIIYLGHTAAWPPPAQLQSSCLWFNRYAKTEAPSTKNWKLW